MSTSHETRGPLRRIVIKFGTGVLTKSAQGTIDREQIERITSEVAEVVSGGRQCLMVSSGAVGAGLPVFGLEGMPDQLPMRQACAAVGQTRLMHLYEEHFAKHSLAVAQLLLTHDDIDSRTRYQNARNTLAYLLAAGNVVPIINENDSVAVAELRLRLGDNDRLSAEVARLARADLLVLFTGVDALMDTRDGGSSVVREVRDFSEARPLAREDRGTLSMGGMASKLDAAEMAVKAGIPTIIANGRTPGLLKAILNGERVGTYFPAHVRGGEAADEV